MLKRNKKNLIIQEQEIRNFAESIPVGIFRTNTQGIKTYVNSHWCDITKISYEEVLKNSAQKSVHPDDKEWLSNEWKNAIENKLSFKAQYRYLQPDNSITWVLENAIPETDEAGNLIGYIGIIIDITKNKNEELAVRESEYKYRTLFNSVKDGIIVIDGDTGKISNANSYICELLGYSIDELLGKQLWEIGLVKNGVAIRLNYEKLLKDRYIRYENLPLQAKNGSIKEVEFISCVYEINEHKIVGCIIRDISDRKRVEEELRKYREHLEDIVRERTKELEEKNEIFIGRELRIEELKEENKKLKEEIAKLKEELNKLQSKK